MVGPLTLTGTIPGQAGGPGELIFLLSNLVWCDPSGTDLDQHGQCPLDILMMSCSWFK